MPEPNEPLSERELEILRLVATGAANKEIARQLMISPNTVKVHLRNIFAKIGVSSRTEATLYAMNIGLVKTITPLEEPASDTHQPETSLEDLSQSRRSTQSLAQNPWRLGLAALGILALMAVAVVGYPLLNPSPEIAAETAAAQSTLAAAPLSRWTSEPDLPSPRKGMGAVEYENALYLLAGQSTQGIDGATLRYRLADSTWESLASKPTKVTDVQAALIGEKIFVPGGCLPDGSATDALEVFDPRQNSWEVKASLPAPSCAYALATYEGQLYLFGGKRSSDYLDAIHVYDPQEDRWQTRHPLSSPRAYASAVAVNGKILLIGGYDGQQALSLNEAYFPNREIAGEEAWENYASLPSGRYAVGVTQLAELVYLLGGSGNEGVLADAQALQYFPQTDEWFAFETSPQPAGSSPAVLAVGSFLHTLGGETPTGLSASHQSYQAIYTINVPILSDEK